MTKLTAPAAPPSPSAPSAAAYWRKTRRLTLILLAVWFLVTFGAIFFARELDHITLFGWPLSFYMAAQGVMLVYLVIVLIYTVCTNRAERQWQAANEDNHGE